MASPAPELLQFPYSPYNEKVRWALDWKGVPHTRRDLLPGPHLRPIRRLTGQGQVPVVRFGDEVVFGSARILDELERRHPEPPLYPADPELRRRALEIQEHFDTEVGPGVRRALFSVLLTEPGYLCRIFASTHPLPVRFLYRAMLPAVRPLMRRSMQVDDPEAVAQGFEATRRGLDFVARHAGPTGHLVGGSFSVADLAAAALLAPACDPPGGSMERPRPMPESMQGWLARWAEHPGAAWVLERYRKDRPPSAELD